MRVCVELGVGLFIRAAAILRLTALWLLSLSRSTRVDQIIILCWDLLRSQGELLWEGLPAPVTDSSVVIVAV